MTQVTGKAGTVQDGLQFNEGSSKTGVELNWRINSALAMHGYSSLTGDQTGIRLLTTHRRLSLMLIGDTKDTNTTESSIKKPSWIHVSKHINRLNKPESCKNTVFIPDKLAPSKI